MVDILAFGAHPDDVEFACGALLAKMAALGKSVAIVDLTLGDKGTNGSIEIRRKEGENAAALIGATREFLGFRDCEIIDTFAAREELVRVIRRYRPRLVIAPPWEGEQNHPDHVATGRLVRIACRFSAFKNIVSDVAVHKVEGVLHYPGPVMQKLDFLFDVTPHVEIWKKMMNCHESQMKTFDYVAWNLKRAANLGVMMQVEYAQCLSAANPVIVEDVMHIAKVAKEL